MENEELKPVIPEGMEHADLETAEKVARRHQELFVELARANGFRWHESGFDEKIQPRRALLVATMAVLLSELAEILREERAREDAR